MPANRRHFLAAGALGLATACADEPAGSGKADRLYAKGDFEAADRAYRRVLKDEPDHVGALAGAGSIALLGNRFDDARACLEKVLEQRPGHTRARQELAEIAYRKGDFRAAAKWMRKLDSKRLGPTLRKCEALAKVDAYRIEGGMREIRLPFEKLDPLPVVEVGLSDGTTVPFFIDTGGRELLIDRSLVDRLELPFFGVESGHGAGAGLAEYGAALLDSATFGGLRIGNVPVVTLDLVKTGIAKTFAPEGVMGAIGTGFLYRFLSTIDYAGRALILGPANAARTVIRGRRHSVPFWLSGTHYLLARATVGDAPRQLLMVDTGGAGTALFPTKPTVERSGIELQHDKAATGAGAGGKATVVPFVVDRLTLGDVTRRNLPGMYAPEGDLDKVLREDGLVRRPYPIGGMISHEFFKPYALTFDFRSMRLLLDG